jgi:asparagine synthase (glutamine-hydrolysing)
MCGLVSYFFSDVKSGDSLLPNKETISRLSAAVSALNHRGPDDFGIYFKTDLRVGLGHTRLSILDPSSLGHQPMTSSDGMVTLIFNGEIYNFQDLREELVSKGHHFNGNSDTEVLLQYYLIHGVEMLSRLNGIFAFVLWDEHRGGMLVARDALGVKPLYYAVEDGLFACASEIKALQLVAPAVRNMDPTALQRYLTFLWCPGEQTPLDSIHKLGPGQALWVVNGEIERHWAWYILPAFLPKSQRLPMISNKVEAVQSTINHLRKAVYRQMVSDVPIGAFLSGGLDSSSIVAIAKERNPDIRCFTIDSIGGQEEGAIDDLPYARKVAKHLGVPLDVIQIDSTKMAVDLERMVAQLEEPLADPAPLNVLYISQLARQQGIKVLLSGAGGDDLFTGYRRHRALMAERWWSWLPDPVRAGLSKVTSSLDQRNMLCRRLAKLFSGAALEGDLRLVNYFRWSRRADLDRLYSPDFRSAIGKSIAEEPMLDFIRGLPPDTSRIERLLALEQRFFLTDHNLLYTDKMSMAVGVEVRVPFLDLELVEFASRIPTHFKQRGNEGKFVLKKAMEPFLPHDVIYRAKSGFGVPLRRWIRFELREQLGDLLGEASIRRRGLFEPVAVQKLIAANDSGVLDASYTLFSLMCIELWCRRFIDDVSKQIFGIGAQEQHH